MAKNAPHLLVYEALWGANASHTASAEDLTQPFTMSCINNGGKSIYFSIDLASKKGS